MSKPLTAQDDKKIRIALIDLKHIEQNRTLLKGHFSLVAKRHGIKVLELRKAYGEKKMETEE